jgi:hypothetical protein
LFCTGEALSFQSEADFVGWGWFYFAKTGDRVFANSVSAGWYAEVGCRAVGDLGEGVDELFTLVACGLVVDSFLSTSLNATTNICSI